LFLSALGIGAALWIIPIMAQMNPIPEWIWIKLDVFTKGLFSQKTPWSFTSLLPAALFSFWFLAWLILQTTRKKPHPAMLFLISGCVALFTSLWILPPVAKWLQGPVTQTIQQETRKGVFLEAWYYKTYALYFHGKFTPKDFQDLKPEQPVAPEDPYPKQTARRSHALNIQNPEKTKVITKNNYQPDESFLKKFQKERDIGGYVLWKKQIQQP
jgi:hypothetical protein